MGRPAGAVFRPRAALPAVTALALLAAAASGCSGPKACVRPGYSFAVLEPDGRPAADALVTFEQVERNAEGEIVRTLGGEVTLAASAEGKIVVGPQRGRTPKPERRIKRYTRVVVAMPDGRRIETFHAVKPRVTCQILEAEPLVLQSEDFDRDGASDTGD